MHSAMKSKNNEKIGINEFPRKGDKKYNRESFCLSVCVCVVLCVSLSMRFMRNGIYICLF